MNILNCIYKAGVRTEQETKVTISEIISQIKSKKYSYQVQEIQKASSNGLEEIKSKLKLDLPVFYPTLISSKPEVASGIVQFDIDVKNNPNLDMDELATFLCRLPSTYYLFKSPNQGLKFGVLTDFSNVLNENTEQLKYRFKFSYNYILDLLHDLDFMPNFEADASVASIKQACYLSHDTQAYLNECAIPISVNDESSKIAFQGSSKDINLKIATSHEISSNVEYIRELLNWIPKYLGYAERRPINYTVCGLLGENSGVNVLLAHWIGDSHKLQKQIFNQLKYQQFESHIGTLVNAAKKYGYQTAHGCARNKLIPQPSKSKLPELLSAEQAELELKHTINSFFETRDNTYISISTGAGKTNCVINILAEVKMAKTKVLVLVKNHELGEQIESLLKDEISKRRNLYKEFSIERYKYKNSVIRIKGQSQPLFKGSGITMCSEGNSNSGKFLAPNDCNDNCFLQGECDYTEQFTSLTNIRIMTHNEWFNKPSKWSNGQDVKILRIYENPFGDHIEDYTVSPAKSGPSWRPEFIVIDEDIMAIDEIDRPKEDISSPHSSFKTIIENLKVNNNLVLALNRSKLLISENSKDNYKTFYKNDKNKYEKNPNYSEILNCFNKYLVTSESSCLNGIHFKDDTLYINRLKQVADRYKDTPTLILDASANSKVIEKVYPNYKFVKLTVKINSEINIYQMCNANITKKHLEDAKNLSELVTGLKIFIQDYKQVGLISYQSIEGESKFTETLADKLGVNLFAHFGDLRGLNTFENVDCLLVVGRYSLPQNQTEKLAKAIYSVNELENDERTYLPKIVRMKSGKAYSLDNRIYNNSLLQSVYEHKSVAETVQAIGRGRLIYGKPKDVFLFSSESLGLDIEITDFFRYEDYFIKTRLSESVIEKIKNIGFLDTRTKQIALLLSEIDFEVKNNVENFVKNHKPHILDELKHAGFRPHNQISKFLIYNPQKFEDFQKTIN